MFPKAMEELKCTLVTPDPADSGRYNFLYQGFQFRAEHVEDDKSSLAITTTIYTVSAEDVDLAHVMQGQLNTLMPFSDIKAYPYFDEKANDDAIWQALYNEAAAGITGE